MAKTDKELAVELARAVMISAAIKSNAPKPIDGEFVNVILRDCYEAVASLPQTKECK